MEREEMKRIQKEMEKRLGDDWDIQPVTVNKVGGATGRPVLPVSGGEHGCDGIPGEL